MFIYLCVYEPLLGRNPGGPNNTRVGLTIDIDVTLPESGGRRLHGVDQLFGIYIV